MNLWSLISGIYFYLNFGLSRVKGEEDHRPPTFRVLSEVSSCKANMENGTRFESCAVSYPVFFYFYVGLSESGESNAASGLKTAEAAVSGHSIEIKDHSTNGRNICMFIKQSCCFFIIS